MGNNNVKNKDSKETKIVPKKKNLDSSSSIALLVIHGDNMMVDDIFDHFSDAINTFPPPGSLEIKTSNIKKIAISSANTLDMKQWIYDHLKQQSIVLIALLCSFNLQSLMKEENEIDKFISASFEKDKLIIFSFNIELGIEKNIMLKLDPAVIKNPKSFDGKLDELVATIKAE